MRGGNSAEGPGPEGAGPDPTEQGERLGHTHHVGTDSAQAWGIAFFIQNSKGNVRLRRTYRIHVAVSTLPAPVRVLRTCPGHKDRQLPSKQTLVAKIPGTRGDSWNLAFLRPKDAETSPGRRSPRGNRLASAPQCPERRQSPTQTLLLLPPQPGVGNRRGLHAYDSERRRDSSARDTKPDLDPRSRQKCSMEACLVSRSRQKCPTEASLDTRPLPCQVEASLDACRR